MWQKCPTCNGTGIAMTVSSSHSRCPTCRGMRIISELNGLPPFIVDVNSTESVTNVIVLKGTDSKDDITSSQTEISDKPHSTITDQIDGIIFEMPFIEKMKLWELINRLVNESQTEISDEDIYKEAEHKSKIFRGWTTYETSAFIMACQWYREQLKKKQ